MQRRANYTEGAGGVSRERETERGTPKREGEHVELEGSGGGKKVTYARQCDLPRLPIPSLQETADTFLRMVKPLLNASEMQKVEHELREFLQDDAQGPALQRLLREYDAKKGVASYIEEWFNESYLVPDSSVVLNLNPFFLLEDDPTPHGTSQAARAASLVFSSLKFVSALKFERLQPDVWRGKPLCMSQFKRMFGAARIPSSVADKWVVSEESTHVVVLSKNHFYYFDALWPTGEVGVTENQILETLKTILSDSERLEASEEEGSCPPVGVLTSAKRSVWAKSRAQLCAISANNEKILQLIDSALFVVCLDDSMPDTVASRAANMLHGSYQLHESGMQKGTLCNRWYDKLQIVVCANGVAGINFEHFSVDGQTVLRYVSDVFADSIIRFASSITKTMHGKGYLRPVIDAPIVDAKKITNGPRIEPRRLSWDLDESISMNIHYAETSLSDQIMQSDTAVLEFSSYGKRWIVQQKMSPDAFLQVCMATAYYELYGTFVSTYESVSTKAYFHGRTEAGRMCTTELQDFARVLSKRETSAAVKMRRFREAIKAHSSIVKLCCRGKGVDRHLFALNAMCREHGVKVPPFLEGHAYKKLTTSILSTSNCGNPSLRLFGFGPVVSMGFGIGYIIADDRMSLCVTSKHRQTQRYVRCLELVLQKMYTMFDAGASKAPSHVKKLREESGMNMEDSASMGGYGFFDSGDLADDIALPRSGSTSSLDVIGPLGKRI
eukprot:g4057.t1